MNFPSSRFPVFWFSRFLPLCVLRVSAVGFSHVSRPHLSPLWGFKVFAHAARL